MSDNDKLPLVSIITVVYNDELHIEETIQSVINQTYENVEYIIIDGRSTDGTIEIIKKYTNKINYWISEPDKGIYDAMNKGIKMAKGEWFNFLNSGDKYIDNNVLSRIFTKDMIDKTLIYGDVHVLKENGQTEYKHAISLKDEKSIMKGMLICHQAIFYNTQILELYDSNLKIMAEWKHLLKITRHQLFKPLKLELPIVYYRLGGLSSKQLQLTHFELQKVFYEEFGIINYLKYMPYFINVTIRGLLKSLLIKLRII